MKNKIILSFTCLFSLCASVNAQMQNGGMENWTGGSPNNWFTSNVPVASLITVTQSSDQNSGTSAAYGEVVPFNTTVVAPILQSGVDGTGFPISQRYLALELFYKFTPVSGDRFGVNISFEKNGNVIAQGAVALPNAVNSYTSLTVPMTYTTSDIPDNAIIQIMIVGPTGADYHLGSEMFVDDIAFSMTNAIENISDENSMVKNFPNPASETISIFVPDFLSENIEIYDLQGIKVKSVKVDETKKEQNYYQLNVSDLPSGSYFYRVSTAKSSLNNRFIVSH